MATKAVTDASFQADVVDSDKPVLVDFWADWCGPCKMIAPALEEISDELADQGGHHGKTGPPRETGRSGYSVSGTLQEW